MFLISIIQAMRIAVTAMRVERELSRLDDRALAEMGLTRADIVKVALRMAE